LKTTISEKRLDNAAVTHLKQSGVQVDNYLATTLIKKNQLELEKRFSLKRYSWMNISKVLRVETRKRENIEAGFNKEKIWIFCRVSKHRPTNILRALFEKKESKWVTIKTVMASQRYY
jgi:hypothetical protein